MKVTAAALPPSAAVLAAQDVLTTLTVGQNYLMTPDEGETVKACRMNLRRATARIGKRIRFRAVGDAVYFVLAEPKAVTAPAEDKPAAAPKSTKSK